VTWDPASRIPPTAAPHRFGAWAGAALLAAGFALLVVVISPRHNTPVQDDWDYARTVAIFLHTGTFQRSALAQATEIFTTAWGALFAAPLGFSFVSLRLSTLCLSVLAVLLFYALLGQLGFDVPRRVVGAATLLASPLFVYLSFSFMTDVPALFWMIAALLLFVLGLKRDDARLALLGSACACLAFLTRQIGLVPAFAAAAFYAWSAVPGRRLRFVAASLALPVVVALAYGWWSLNGGVNWANAQLTVAGTRDFLFSPGMPLVVVRRVVIYALTLAFYLLPIWLGATAALPRLRALRAQARPADWAFGALIGLIFGVEIAHLGAAGQWQPYLADALTGAGLRPYLGYFAYQAGSRRPDLLPAGARAALTAVCGLLACALACLAFATLRRRDASERRTGRWLVYAVGIALAVPTLLFNTAFERYILPLLPIAIVLLLDVTSRLRLSRPLAGLGLAGMALLSVALMRDFWGWMDARWTAAESLVARGVPLDMLDAGYEWDGWQLYDDSMAYIRAHPEPLSVNPWEYIIDPEYIMSFTPLADYAVELKIDFNSPFGPNEGRFYVLRRLPSGELQGTG
jgi:4-amino-4-deoxy-L-arabinose transferase-like glycosyltransferase